MFPEPQADYAARLPRLFRELVDAIDAAGWDHTVHAVGPFRVADVHREVVEVAASTRTGHRVRAWFTADGPPDGPRPPFAPAMALVGQGAGVGDASVSVAVAYVRRRRVRGRPPN